MRTLFADTLYWVAVIHPRDHWRDAVLRLGRTLKPVCLVTTEEVLVEVLTALSAEGAHIRRLAVEYIGALYEDPGVVIRSQTPESFAAGLDLYARRADKSYSMTDCISMATMRALGLTEVLTGDEHFRQEGFIILL